MRAILLRIGEPGKAGYPLELFEGDQDAVLQRVSDEDAADVTTLIPLDAAGTGPDFGAGAMDATTMFALIAGEDAGASTLRDAGVQLFALLNRGDVGKRWCAALKTARKEWVGLNDAQKLTDGVRLRTYLEVRAPTLARLPWELMQDKGDMLALQTWAPLTRYVDTSAAAHGTDDLELRVLLVIGCHPKANDGIEWVAELKSFLATVCPQRDAIDFEVFEAYSRSRLGDLKGALRTTISKFKPHILHFVGHGRSDGGEGALELFDSSVNDTVSWTAQDLTNWLKDAPPSVVLLNACRTSEGAAEPDAAIKVLASMAGAALSANVGCVIAMQHDIAGQAAASFAESFYGALAEQHPVDIAVINGRQRIADKLNLEDRNWALPVCTVGTAPEGLLPRLDRIPMKRRTTVRVHPELGSLLSYVDRRAERRAIINPALNAPSKHLAFVLSDAKMGKSSLARLIAAWRWLVDNDVVYVDFGATKKSGPLDVIEVLRHIRGADDAPLDDLRWPLYEDLAEFHDVLNAVLDDKPAGAVRSTGRDTGVTFDRNKVTSPRAWDQIFGSFLAGLLARKRRLTVVLDHLTRLGGGVVPEDFKEHIVSRLLVPIHRGDIPNVSVVIAATESEIAQCGLTALRDFSVCASLEDFPFEDWELMAREFAVREKMNSEVAEYAIENYAKFLRKRAWKPRSLLKMKQAYEDALAGDE